MMKTTIVKQLIFSAGHRIYNAEYSDEKNREIFGACSNPNGHGHNYTLEVHFSGPIDGETGMVLNLKEIKKVVEEEIISKLDHKNLNLDVDFMAGVIPTTENLAQKLFEVLDSRFSGGLLSKVVLWETPSNRVEIDR
jgi:6-pyruvoyltetrahydropterin/6-carboxytetrahydropterin synthase